MFFFLNLVGWLLLFRLIKCGYIPEHWMLNIWSIKESKMRVWRHLDSISSILSIVFFPIAYPVTPVFQFFFQIFRKIQKKEEFFFNQFFILISGIFLFGPLELVQPHLSISYLLRTQFRFWFEFVLFHSRPLFFHSFIGRFFILPLKV